MDQIRKALSDITSRMREAAATAHGEPDQVRLIAVSKTRSATEIRAAFAAGLRDFGENYLQEALPKIEALSDLPIQWHFVGAIQSNKTRSIATHFDWVHTIDREKIALRLSGARPPGMARLNVLIQVNVDAEPQKAGIAPEALAELLVAVAPLPGIRVRGLMAIPRARAAGEDPAAPFAGLRALFEKCRDLAGPSWDTLSMGMSADFETAIAQGATMVRIGTALFGPRGS